MAPISSAGCVSYKNYGESSRAFAREDGASEQATPHFTVVPIRPKMVSAPYLAERGLL
jgi:hypothetical protein